ncbi:HET-domain-containing protein [Xylaria longipes]|nr:HET-domain-containing protein [Xylaria longipes]
MTSANSDSFNNEQDGRCRLQCNTKSDIWKIVEPFCCFPTREKKTFTEDSQVAPSVDAVSFLPKRGRPKGGPENEKSLARRLCASCLRLTLTEIDVGKTLYFNAATLPNQLGCNLCQFFGALYADHLEFRRRRLVEKPNTIPQKTTLTHAIRVDLLERSEDAHNQEQLGGLLVFDTRISDTWFGNSSPKTLFFRDRRFVNSSARESERLGLGLDAQDPKPVLAHGVFSKWADLAQAQLWVHECIHRHRGCQSIVSGTPECGSLHATTRFIDVWQRRLVQLDEIFSAVPLEYVAISYVWGRDYQLRTLSGNLAAFRKRLPKNDAGPGERIPQTIEDAMLVTQSLGYRFLWVDALCIVQDSEQDLSLQLAQMDAIYGLAVISIAARGSCSSDSGLLGISAPRGCVSGQSDAEVMVNDEVSVGVWDLVNGNEEFEERTGKLADKQYYIWRGWTFQEQILSTRIIEFNLHSMVFWCGKNESCQERGYPKFATTDMHNPHHFRHSVRKYQRHEKLFPDCKSLEDVVDDDWLLSRWNTIRATHSKRSLTYYVDRRRAIGGTAAAMNEIIGGIDKDGVVRRKIHAELVWYLDLKEEETEALKPFAEKVPEGLFPSWSWLNLWPVTWPALCEPLGEAFIRILNDSESTNNLALDIESPMLELRLAEDLQGTKKLAYPGGNLANIKLRLDLPLEKGLEVTCVPLARAISSMWWERELLLLRCEGQHYTRIGIGSVPEHKSEVFNSALNSENGRRRRILCL